MMMGDFKLKTTKLLISAVAALLLSGAALAEDTKQKAREVCASFSEVAGVIMTELQGGTSMREMMERAAGREPHEKMVIEAFNHPAYSTAEIQQKTINEFADRWYLLCARSWETKK